MANVHVAAPRIVRATKKRQKRFARDAVEFILGSAFLLTMALAMISWSFGK